MSEPVPPVATNTLSKQKNNIVVVSHASSNVYFRPDTEEVILLSDDVAGEFNTHCAQLMTCMDDMHHAGELYSTAVERYGKGFCTVSARDSEHQLEVTAVKQQETLNDKKKALQGMLGDFSPKGYDTIVELIPIVTRKRHGNRSGLGSRYVYARKGYYDQLGAGKKHTVSMNQRSSPEGSIYTYDADGNRKNIDIAKLKAQLKKLPEVKLPVALFSIDDDDIGHIDKTLTGWADAWNNSLVVDGINIGSHIDVSAGAQFMRFTANAGASGEWEAKSGKLAFKAEASAVLAIAQGSASAEYYLPDRIGWPLVYIPNGAGTPLNMGMLRVYFETELVGFAGASAQIENQLH